MCMKIYLIQKQNFHRLRRPFDRETDNQHFENKAENKQKKLSYVPKLQIYFFFFRHFDTIYFHFHVILMVITKRTFPE